MMKKRMILLLPVVVCLVMCHQACGQSQADKVPCEIEVVADSVAVVGQQYKIGYKYTYMEESDGLVAPKWSWRSNGCNMLMGPSKSTQSTFTMDHGKAKQTYSITYIYILEFTKAGTYVIPPLTTKTNKGRTITSDSFMVNVLPKGSKLPEPASNKVIVVEAKVNKDSIELGDHVECEVKLYTDANVTNMSPYSIYPIDNAYWIESDISKDSSVGFEEYKGQKLRSVVLAKFVLVPMQTGKITIGPIKYTASYVISSPDEDPLDAFINGGSPYKNKETVIQTQPVVINVKEGRKPATSALPVIPISSPTHSWGLVIDRSSSLQSKIDTLGLSFMDLENQFVQQLLTEEELGQPSVMLFAKKPHTPTPSELKKLSLVKPKTENDGSAVYQAILANALREGALTTERSPYSILLLTDGSDNASRIYVSTLKNLLLRKKIRVDVIAFGSRQDSVYYDFKMKGSLGWIKIANQQCFNEVEDLAKATNGVFMLIEDKKQLPMAIQRIKEQMQKAQVPTQAAQPNFRPDEGMLHQLYQETLRESETAF